MLLGHLAWPTHALPGSRRPADVAGLEGRERLARATRRQRLEDLEIDLENPFYKEVEALREQERLAHEAAAPGAAQHSMALHIPGYSDDESEGEAIYIYIYIYVYTCNVYVPYIYM